MGTTPNRPERWLPVCDYEGFYEVSDMGRVRSLDRYVRSVRATSGIMLRRGKVLAPVLAGNMHFEVSLCREGGQEQRYIHRMVLDAFAEPCPPGHQALHGPAGALVNWWPENLYWGTPSRNQGIDKHRDGTLYNAKLTPELVVICRARRARGEYYKTMAADYGVSKTTIMKAVNGETWGHIPMPD